MPDSPRSRDFETRLLAQARWVLPLARRLAHDAAAAEDLSQEAWRAALERRPSTSALGPWLARVLRNLASKARRGGRRRLERERDSARAEAQPSSADVVAFAAMQRDLVAAVLALDEPYRTTVLWRYLEERSLGAIAAEQGVSVRTVETRLARGLARLRARLATRSGTDDGGLADWLGAFLALAPDAWRTWTLGELLMKKKVLLAALLLVLFGGGARLWRALSSSETERFSSEASPALESARAEEAHEPTGPRLAASEPDPRVAAARPRGPEAESEAAARARRERELSGVVVTSDGRPIAGAELALYRPLERQLRSFTPEPDPSEPLAETRSDELGRFAFELEPHRPHDLVARAAGRLARVVDLCAGEFERVVLPVAAGLEGRVTGPADEGTLAGVRLTLRAEPATPGPAPTAVSDAQGHYAFDDLEPGVYRLDVRALGRLPAPWRQVVLVEGEHRFLDVELATGVVARGRVTDGVTHEPIAGASVGLRDGLSALSVATDAEGRYELPGLEVGGQAELVLRAPGYGRFDFRLDPVPSEGLEQDFALLPGRRVRGRVVDFVGAPVAGASVCLGARNPSGLDEARTATDASGGFVFEDVRRDLRHSLLVLAAGHAAALRDLPASEWETADLTLEPIRLARPGVLAGHVVDDRGEPVAGFRLSLGGEPRERDAWGPSLVGDEGYVTSGGLAFGPTRSRTDERGRYAFAALPPGRYVVSFDEPGRVGGDRLTVVLEEGECLDDVDFVLGSGLELGGLIVDERGRPQVAAGVYLAPPGAWSLDWLATIETDANGRFHFAGLEPGAYRVRVRATWNEEQQRPGRSQALFDDLAAGSTDLRLVLPEEQRVSGRVLGPDRRPVSLAVLARLEDLDKVHILGYADLEGRFALEFPRDERVTLVAWDGAGGWMNVSPFGEGDRIDPRIAAVAELRVASPQELELVLPSLR